MAYKILIVDDEKMMTELLTDHLQDCGYETMAANSAGEAISLLPKQPDLIILDINMPGMDGLELCRNIRSHIACPILFLTARITEQDKINGLQYGGDDYIAKPFSLGELSARVAAHLRRDERSRSRPSVLTSNGLIVNLSQRLVSWNGQEIAFSKREFDLIAFLMTNANQVFDKERIYEMVWGYDAEGDSNVIKEYVRKIRARLREVTGLDYIETVWGVGYKWKKDFP
ncbi:response regulator transcription factor [Acetatifactor aquisgranensis]|uniref:response regulator transcription factor n=1 Tax=Acetatifactor aquisgranensis TaxID=2941233 RepID=UPI00203E0E61|nr:response regulator transcription factor [Acetatifactor aquisgranensis]